VKIADLDESTRDLSVKNPNRKDEAVLRDPKEIIDEMRELDKESAEILKTIQGLV
jgi:type I restriction enzyme M protein